MQRKMTNTMTMQEQIQMSGLEIVSSLSSSSSSSSQLQWSSTNQWSPILGGGRRGQACVTIESGNENGTGGQADVVIGGRMQSGEYTNSVIVWDPSTKRWRNGPSLNDKRSKLVPVVVPVVVVLVVFVICASPTRQIPSFVVVVVLKKEAAAASC